MTLKESDFDYGIKNVELPQIRGSLIIYLNWLSDEEYQRFIWITPNNKMGFYSNLYYPIGLMLEEQNLEEEGQAMRTIGAICKDKREAKAIEKVAKLLDEITEEAYGEDDVYLESPLYPELIKASKEAYEVFIENEKDNKEFLDFIEAVKVNMQKKIEEAKA